LEEWHAYFQKNPEINAIPIIESQAILNHKTLCFLEEINSMYMVNTTHAEKRTLATNTISRNPPYGVNLDSIGHP
jgi:hypothetical protein